MLEYPIGFFLQGRIASSDLKAHQILGQMFLLIAILLAVVAGVSITFASYIDSGKK